jgi:hypothetical protein
MPAPLRPVNYFFSAALPFSSLACAACESTAPSGSLRRLRAGARNDLPLGTPDAALGDD